MHLNALTGRHYLEFKVRYIEQSAQNITLCMQRLVKSRLQSGTRVWGPRQLEPMVEEDGIHCEVKSPPTEQQGLKLYGCPYPYLKIVGVGQGSSTVLVAPLHFCSSVLRFYIGQLLGTEPKTMKTSNHGAQGRFQLLDFLIGLLAPHRIIGLDGLSTLEDLQILSQEELPTKEEQNTPLVRYNN